MYWKKHSAPQKSSPDLSAAAGNLGISMPKNTADLKALLERFGPMLDDKNRSFITELISELEQGGDPKALTDLAARMKQAAEKQK